MPGLHCRSRHAAAMSAALLLVLAAGCSRNDQGAGPGAAAPARGTTVTQAMPASRLGDLSAFRRIATDASSIVDKGDLPAARTRIKDLEVEWDAAEAGLKPRDAANWHVLDKAIDRALAALRADTPTQADCKAALAGLLTTFDKLQSRS
jgi:hypothetical protein